MLYEDDSSNSLSVLVPAPSTEVPTDCLMLPADTPSPSSEDEPFEWTAGKIVLSITLFIIAGIAEIGGGWLVWQTLRNDKAWWFAVIGALVLFLYGVIPTFQPVDNFGRVYAVYGGFFIILSYLWGWAVDGDKPDTPDWIGSAVAIVGVCLAFFWPR